MPDPTRVRLVARGITKRYPGVIALHDVDLDLRGGEVLAVVGENGAGKSTLMSILAGVQAADAGEVSVDGMPVPSGSVPAALRRGIALIHQELNLADNLDVAGNVFLGREPRGRFGLLDHRAAHERARPFLDEVGLNLDPATPVAELALGHRQLVEIAAALSADARILIMDEPTSSLTLRETRRLFEVVKRLRNSGTAVIYISHRLGEVEELADRALVLRDGELAGELEREQISHDALVRLMVGRDVERFYRRTPHQPGQPALVARGVCTRARPRQPVDLTVHAGEVVGLAGLVGAGRTELLEALFAITPPVSGQVFVHGRPLHASHPRAAIACGLGLVPEDRKAAGLLLEMSVRANLTLAAQAYLPATRGTREPLRRGPFRRRRAETRLAQQLLTRLGVRPPDPSRLAHTLSGGNQQKIVLGRWLALEPRVLLLDEPTRGVDVGGKQEIYQLVHELAAGGVAILFASSEMEEILGLADRVLVMHEGAMAGSLTRAEATEQAVMSLATAAATAAGMDASAPPGHDGAPVP